MNPALAADLAAEKRNNAATITGLQNRIQLSQEEIDVLTARNTAIDAQLAAEPAAEPPSEQPAADKPPKAKK